MHCQGAGANNKCVGSLDMRVLGDGSLDTLESSTVYFLTLASRVDCVWLLRPRFLRASSGGGCLALKGRPLQQGGLGGNGGAFQREEPPGRSFWIVSRPFGTFRGVTGPFQGGWGGGFRLPPSPHPRADVRPDCHLILP